MMNVHMTIADVPEREFQYGGLFYELGFQGIKRTLRDMNALAVTLRRCQNMGYSVCLTPRDLGEIALRIEWLESRLAEKENER